jgi:hypothetical protein
MAYNAEFIEGFDKYGIVGTKIDVSTLGLFTGDWTAWTGTLSASNNYIAPSLLGAGNALRFEPGSTTSFNGISKTFPANYARMVGGIYLQSSLHVLCGVQFLDNGTAQLSIVVNLSGQIEIRRGSIGTGTILATTTQTLAADVPACVEWDITIHSTTGIAKIWINGVATSVAIAGQNTRASANNYLNQIQLGTYNNLTSNKFTVDHLYCWLFTAAGGAETPALTNPVVETQFPTGDSGTIAFTFGSGVLGAVQSTGTTVTGSANRLFLRKYTPTVAATLGSLRINPSATSAGAKFKGVVYADSSGVPGTLLTSGTELVGVVANTRATLTLTSAQTLAAGTSVWVGYITDTSVAFNTTDLLNSGYAASNTYTSGAPGTAPTMTAGIGSQVVFGVVTGVAVNWPQVDENPAVGVLSYNTSSTVNAEDLFTFPALGSTPTVIYTVAVKALVMRSDAGARTVDLRLKSNTTTSSGSVTGQTPAASFATIGSYFDLDPNGSIAWTASAVNAASSGLKIIS